MPSLRNKFLIRLGYQTGMRVSEIISIKLQHLDREEREIRVPAVASKSGSCTVVYKPSLNIASDDATAAYKDRGGPPEE